MARFTEGTSKTAAISEVITVEEQDTRGAMHFGAASIYMHDQAANTTTARVIGITNEWEDLTRYCGDSEDLAAPCDVSKNQRRDQWNHNARSVRAGGINLVRVDASVSFINDEIDLAVWQALSTPNGEEVLSENP